MEDESKLRQAVDKAGKAKRYLEDAVFTEAVAAIRADIVRQFERAHPMDEESLRLARLRLDALEGVLGNIRRYIEDGKIAASQLEKLAQRLNPLR